MAKNIDTSNIQSELSGSSFFQKPDKIEEIPVTISKLATTASNIALNDSKLATTASTLDSTSSFDNNLFIQTAKKLIDLEDSSETIFVRASKQEKDFYDNFLYELKLKGVNTKKVNMSKLTRFILFYFIKNNKEELAKALVDLTKKKDVDLEV